MLRIMLLAACALWAAPALAGGGAAKAAPLRPAAGHKPGSAPVDVRARVGAGSAQLEVAFKAEGHDVSVEVYGVDGLRVLSAARPVNGAQVGPGQPLAIDVTFDAPPGESNLAVVVQGTFGGQRRSQAASFTVGHRAASQANRARREVQVDAGGERVHIVHARQK